MASSNCTIVGQDWAMNKGVLGDDFGSNAGYAGANSSTCYTYILQFKTPSFTGVAKKISINMYVKAQVHLSATLRYALTTSVDNISSYQNYGGQTTYPEVTKDNDPNQITYGLFELTNLDKNTHTHYTLELDATTLSPDTAYYLVLWGPNNVSLIGVGEAEYHTVVLDYDDGLVYIDTGSGLEAYQAFVDNGTGWDLLLPHEDNGTGWVQCV